MRLSPFQNGAEASPFYLVEAGARSFLVNARASILLEALCQSGKMDEVISFIHSRSAVPVSPDELLASIARLPRELFDEKLSQEAVAHIRYRLVLIPASLVGKLAKVLTILFSAPAVSVIIMAAVVAAPFSYLAAERAFVADSGAASSVPVLGIGFLVSALIHELGHATAMARYSVSPGHIGCGLYWFFPVLYTDVNGAWRLPPTSRAVVDSGGIFFQTLLVIVLTPTVFFGAEIQSIELLILCNLYSILHSLNPFFKMDGYWMLSDLTRIPNLHRRTRDWLLRTSAFAAMSGRTRTLVAVYGLSVCAYFIYFVRLIPSVFKQQLLPRLDEAAAQVPEIVGAINDQAWIAAGGYIGRAVRTGLVPALTAGLFLVWAAGFFHGVCLAFRGLRRGSRKEPR